MGKVFPELDDDLLTFICQQHVFFVATAPLSSEGHINLSPKGLDTFRLLGPRTVAYLDLTGSGVETIAHLRENGRLTLMFCAFAGPPRVPRLYGKGRVIQPGDAEWEALSTKFPHYTGTRSVIVVDLERIADSSGYGVPRYEYLRERTQLAEWAQRKGAEELRRYQDRENRRSLDGLPGLRPLSGE